MIVPLFALLFLCLVFWQYYCSMCAAIFLTFLGLIYDPELVRRLRCASNPTAIIPPTPSHLVLEFRGERGCLLRLRIRRCPLIRPCPLPRLNHRSCLSWPSSLGNGRRCYRFLGRYRGTSWTPGAYVSVRPFSVRLSTHLFKRTLLRDVM